MADPKPLMVSELVWSGDLRFGATTGSNAIVTDGDTVAGPSPMQLLLIGLAGCMAIDVVDILRKGRHTIESLRVDATAERAADVPRRVVSVGLTFHVRGEMPAAAIERAITMSRDKYCSVWHSLRQDLPFTTDFILNQ